MSKQLSFNRSAIEKRYLCSFKEHYLEASQEYHQQQQKQQLENPEDHQWSVNLRNNCHHQCKHTYTRQPTNFKDTYDWKETALESNSDRVFKTKNGIKKLSGNRPSEKAPRLQRSQLVERLLLDIDRKNAEIQKNIHELKNMLLITNAQQNSKERK
eukprot:Awhi_evm1s2122